MNFNARQYDPQIGRFLGVDPLADAYGQQVYSPYAAMGNMPESAVDPNGTTFTGGDAQIAFRDLQNILGNSTFEEGGFKAGGSGENWETFLSNTMSNPGSYSIESLFANNSNAFLNYLMGGAMQITLSNVTITDRIGSALTSFTGSISRGGVGVTTVLKRGGYIGFLTEAIEGIFISANVPDWANMPYIRSGTFTDSDVKAEAKLFEFQDRDKQTGSYTIIPLIMVRNIMERVLLLE